MFPEIPASNARKETGSQPMNSVGRQLPPIAVLIVAPVQFTRALRLLLVEIPALLFQLIVGLGRDPTCLVDRIGFALAVAEDSTGNRCLHAGLEITQRRLPAIDQDLRETRNLVGFLPNCDAVTSHLPDDGQLGGRSLTGRGHDPPVVLVITKGEGRKEDGTR